MKCGGELSDCEGKAEYECPECGTVYCQECASLSDYECDCVEPPDWKGSKRKKESVNTAVALMRGIASRIMVRRVSRKMRKVVFIKCSTEIFVGLKYAVNYKLIPGGLTLGYKPSQAHFKIVKDLKQIINDTHGQPIKARDKAKYELNEVMEGLRQRYMYYFLKKKEELEKEIGQKLAFFKKLR